MQSAVPMPFATNEAHSLPRTLAGRIGTAIAASAFVAVCAHVSLPLYFTPVPITLQTFAVILVGLVLGPRLGFSAMLLYLAEGAAGLPVFSPHSLGLIGPTAGFLAAYPLAAAAAGSVVRALPAGRSKFSAAITAGLACDLAIFALGAGWIAHLMHLGASAAWHLAVAPFLPGEVLKIAAAAGMYVSLRRWTRS